MIQSLNGNHLAFEILDFRFEIFDCMKKTLTLILVAVMAAGCVTEKKLTYMRELDATRAEAINAQFKSQAQTIIRSGDALTIFVSALDAEAVAPYNLPTVVYAQPGTNTVQTTPMLQYYIVDENGDVAMPVLGKVHVGGMTRVEAEEAVRTQLATQVLNPSVQIRLINAKVSVLGEVNRPGQVTMTGDRLTLIEALAAAGDMTAYGRRDNVLVTREVDGKIEIARINLNSTEIFGSPFYYLQQNDVVYVSPNKVRAVGSTNAGLWISIVGTLASTAAVVVTAVK